MAGSVVWVMCDCLRPPRKTGRLVTHVLSLLTSVLQSEEHARIQ